MSRVVLLVGPQPCGGLRWPCLWCVPRCCFRIVFDSAGSAGVMFGPTLVVGRDITLFRCFVFASAFVGVPVALAGKGLVIPIEPCSRGSPPLLSSGRDLLSQEFVAGRLWWRFVAPCVASSVSCERERLFRSELRVAFLQVLGFWPKARLASISTDVDVVSASTTWTPTLTPTSSDVDANFSDLHELQSPEFREQASSPIGELSPTALSLSHHHSGVPKPLCFKPTPPAPERALFSSLQRGEKTLASCEKSWTLQARIQQCEGVSGLLLQQGGSWNIKEGFPNRDRNLASMPLTPRSLVCVQRSCRPLLERPETAAKFTHYLLRRTGVVGNDTLAEEAVETDSERGD
ncbi:hypothetical protein Taro_010734 [Colocasia esculenta]|uniref:Uncharacterized protein n=1 Tax=Colocasia esculenta TaxID=4460 RepID=A0A843UAH1_COLES|nr:hypothetical protein [Colocasia esculenta]